ncbi:COG2192 Predicted carbamoyl transferase, NodU family [Candidatus Pelagibacterales bacterium]
MNKIIIGINSYHPDSSACIIKNNKIEFAIEEERINRIKHWSGFPIQSIRECLKETNTKIEEITDISINSDPYSNIIPKVIFFMKNYVFGSKKKELIQRSLIKLNIKKELNKELINLSKKIKIHKINHHISHIASAYFPSNFDEAIGLSIDGSGDFSSLCIATCNKKRIKIIKQIYFPNSLGIFYEAMTQVNGFKNFGDEYKLMGLSTYGNPKYSKLIMDNIITENKSFFSLNLKYFNHYKNNFSYNFLGNPKQQNIYNDNLNLLFNIKNDLSNNNISDFQKDLAASTQVVFELKLKHILEYIAKIFKIKNLVFAGGCALNSLANGKILLNSNFSNIFIPYAPSDSGGAIGSAIYTNKFIYKNDTHNLLSPYLGSNYSNEVIEKIIKNNNLNSYKILFIKDFEKLNKFVVEKIINKKIVGWFQSKMEFGSRALGNRSIIADPRDKNIKDIINQKIKRRESFRPFAPAILEEEKKNWFTTNSNNIYMSYVENVIEEKKKYIPAVTHIDGTGRVQVVNKNLNNRFYNLIFEFYKKTNVPILLNTSFNENEPIIRTPQEAIDCFVRTKMDLLIIENFIIERENN